jgi:hypothetical protein
VCYVCSKKFSQKGNLNKHIKSVHKISEEDLKRHEQQQLQEGKASMVDIEGDAALEKYIIEKEVIE